MPAAAPFFPMKGAARPGAIRRRRFRFPNRCRLDAALRMARIPCMMIAGEGIPRCHHFAIKPGFGRICRFSRDFMAANDNPR